MADDCIDQITILKTPCFMFLLPSRLSFGVKVMVRVEYDFLPPKGSTVGYNVWIRDRDAITEEFVTSNTISNPYDEETLLGTITKMILNDDAFIDKIVTLKGPKRGRNYLPN